jgi:xanthine dehydrogenase YagT iron-sulfur-binding subunit
MDEKEKREDGEGKDELTSSCGRGVSRRGFFQLMGAGAMATAVTGRLAEASPAPGTGTPVTTMRITLLVNGRRHALQAEARWSLLYVLREKLGLTGAKAGCERGECGACSVLIDGRPRYSCLTLAVEAEGHEVTTVEGLMKGESLGPVQQAFVEKDAFQCGFCTPGQVMAAEGLLRSHPDPSPGQIRQGMSGNLCRCGAYHYIAAAVGRAAELKKEGR